MPCRRCSICGKNFGTLIYECPDCGNETWFDSTDNPDPIPPAAVVPPPDLERERIVKWRYEALTAADCPEEIANAIALNGSDVHSVMRTRELGASWDQIARIHT